jgi:hypothetical protein
MQCLNGTTVFKPEVGAPAFPLTGVHTQPRQNPATQALNTDLRQQGFHPIEDRQCARRIRFVQFIKPSQECHGAFGPLLGVV